MADEVYRGERVHQLPKANRTYSEGRVCAADGCGTKLSIYNKWQYCNISSTNRNCWYICL